MRGQVGERQVHRSEQLPGLIVQRVGNPLCFLFQRVVETLPGVGTRARAAMAHFERRQTLGEELARRRDHRVRSARAQQRAQGIVMSGGELEHTEAVFKGSLPEAVGPAAALLSRIVEITAQAGRIPDAEALALADVWPLRQACRCLVAFARDSSYGRHLRAMSVMPPPGHDSTWSSSTVRRATVMFAAVARSRY